MNLLQFEYFLSVSETGNISQAAEKLFVSQPAVSKQIISLEREMGVQLFDRAAKGLKLTEDGRLLYDCLQQCRIIYENMRAELTRRQKNHRISLAYQSSMDISDLMLEALPQLEKAGYSLDITAVNTIEIKPEKYDILLTYKSAVGSPHLVSIPVYASEKFIAFSLKDPLAQRDNVSLDDFNGKKFYCGTNAEYSLEICQRHGINPEPISRNNVSSIILATIVNNGFCILDGLCKEMKLNTLRFIPLNESEQIILSYSDSASEDVVSAATSMAAFLSLGMEKQEDHANCVDENTRSQIFPDVQMKL